MISFEEFRPKALDSSGIGKEKPKVAFELLLRVRFEQIAMDAASSILVLSVKLNRSAKPVAKNLSQFCACAEALLSPTVTAVAARRLLKMRMKLSLSSP